MEYPAFSRLVDETIASTGQYDNSQLSCSLCHISFCNSYRKNSHFCGRPHSNELIMKLTQVLEEESSKEQTNDDNGIENNEIDSSECLANDSSSSSVHESSQCPDHSAESSQCPDHSVHESSQCPDHSVHESSQCPDHSSSAIVRIDLTGDDDDDFSVDETSDVTDNDDEGYCNVEESVTISDDLKPSPGYRPALRDAYQAIDNMEGMCGFSASKDVIICD